MNSFLSTEKRYSFSLARMSLVFSVFISLLLLEGMSIGEDILESCAGEAGELPFMLTLRVAEEEGDIDDVVIVVFGIVVGKLDVFDKE